MKAVPTLTVLVALLLLLQPASAQETPPLNTPDYNKPKAFADLPEKFSIDVSRLERLLPLQKGTAVSITVTDGFTLSGNVMSRYVSKDSAVQTIVVKTTRQGATFSFSRVKKAYGRISYKGQLLTPAASDALELVSENGTWAFRKRGYYDLVSE